MISEEICRLISLGTEGANWDFKQEWHSSNTDLLHDIICMANNLEDCDAFIIIGVTNSGGVCGVPETNRKNQQKVIDFLRAVSFAGGVRPTVYVRCLEISKRPIDVIVVKNTANTPYYLEKDYSGLYKGNIYTRVVDTNTPKNENADIDKVEWLWKKRFGLVGSFGRKLKRILASSGWMCEDENYLCEHFFNEYYPEIRIDINEDETAFQVESCTSHDSFFYLYADMMFWAGCGEEKLRRKCYDIRWCGNRMRQFYTIATSRMDFDIVEPEYSFLDRSVDIFMAEGHGLGVQYAYFIEDSVKYMLFQLMPSMQFSDRDGNRYGYSWETFIADVIPVFTDKTEYAEFMNYVIQRREQFKSEYTKLDISRKMFTGAKAKVDPRIGQSFRLGTLLTEWLSMWRRHAEQKKVNTCLTEGGDMA